MSSSTLQRSVDRSEPVAKKLKARKHHPIKTCWWCLVFVLFFFFCMNGSHDQCPDLIMLSVWDRGTKDQASLLLSLCFICFLFYSVLC